MSVNESENKKADKPPYIPEIAKGPIPFNSWSRERIRTHGKRCTSRKKIYLYDGRVHSFDRRQWEFIKHYYWQDEGADSPDELQQVINRIFRRVIKDDEWFIVHWGDFNE